MVSVGVSKLSYTSLIFVDPGVSRSMKPIIMTCCCHNSYVRSLASSSSLSKTVSQHTGWSTSLSMRLLHSSDFWSPNNNDLNLVEYKVCCIMQQRFYQTEMQNVDNLRQCKINGWAGMQQNVIDDVTDRWHSRLRNCMRARWEQFEYSL